MAFLVLALPALFGIRHWFATRTFDPVDIPISLRRGHIRTGAFRINLKRWYFVRFHQGYLPAYDPNCPDSHLNARWTLYRNGQVVADIDEQTTYYYEDGFNGEPGIYDLDAEILSDASCHDPGHPRLIIYTDDSSYQDYKILFTWLVPLSIAIGIALLLVPHAGEINRKLWPSDVLAPSETTGRHFQWAQKLPLKKAVSNLPSFGLLAATIWSFGLLAILIIEPTPRLSIGLIVHLRSDPATSESDLFLQPLVVRIVDGGPTRAPALCLNSRTVFLANIESALEEEMSRRRPDGEIYVQPDPGIDWQTAAQMIGIISRFHGRIMLLTPTDTRFQHKGPKGLCQ